MMDVVKTAESPGYTHITGRYLVRFCIKMLVECGGVCSKARNGPC